MIQLIYDSCCPITIGFSGFLPDALTQKATDNLFLDNLEPSNFVFFEAIVLLGGN